MLPSKGGDFIKYKSTPWEQRNLGVTSCEIILDAKDTIKDFIELERGLTESYRVIKMASKKPEFLFELPKLGYIFVETQISLCIRPGDSRPIPGCEKVLTADDRLEIIQLASEEDLERELGFLRDGSLFDTDRIALDLLFGPEVAGKRYFNWIMDIFRKCQGVYVVKINGQNSSFFTLEQGRNDDFYGAIGGSFKYGQENAYTSVTIEKPNEMAFSLGGKRLLSAVSSNNLPVLRLHLQRGCKVIGLEYVYVKHVI